MYFYPRRDGNGVQTRMLLGGYALIRERVPCVRRTAGLLDNPARSKTAMEEKGGGRGWMSGGWFAAALQKNFSMFLMAVES